MSDTGTLVRMANQIARNYGYLAEPEAAKAVASHLKKFWTPDMCAEFLTGGRDGLDPAARGAADLLAG
jgi:formate dehydrogenase subunit delta